ncbi:hypothetical protein TSAR_015051 [Trichomalopsis sarcophagae]|uniref:Uncharacterized protein n=1 Tax=Trichomalopsis sarcophagae TaxID=543379 RepID=A0A232FA69_9HYME|nr:hypothetical protein TSAR_015051 [Trichomalopsis sarcophagae]
MYVSGLRIYDLFIYSPVTNGSCLIQCEHFYFNYYLPAVRDKMRKSLTSVQNTSSKEVQNVHCQVQMYVSGLTICDLFIYSSVTNGSCLIQVHRNETFLENIIYKCEHFYFNYYLSAVRDKMRKSLTSVQNTSSKEVQNVHVINNDIRSFTGKDISNIKLN